MNWPQNNENVTFKLKLKTELKDGLKIAYNVFYPRKKLGIYNDILGTNIFHKK